MEKIPFLELEENYLVFPCLRSLFLGHWKMQLGGNRAKSAGKAKTALDFLLRQGPKECDVFLARSLTKREG